MDEYLNDDEPMSTPTTSKSKTPKKNVKPIDDLADSISREVIDFIATAEGDPFVISVQAATMIEDKADDISVRVKIAENIFNAGIMMTMDVDHGLNNYLETFHYLIFSLTISLHHYLRILSSYSFKLPFKPENWDLIIEQARRLTICKMLRKSRTSFNCDHWTDEDYRGMRDVVNKVYAFLIECIKTDLSPAVESRDERMRTEYDLTFLEYFSKDVFFINLLKLSNFTQVRVDPRMRTEIQETMRVFDDREIVFEKADTTLTHEWNHSIVDTTVSVFVSARMNVSHEDMAIDIVDAAEMVGVGELMMWKYAVKTAIELILDTRGSPPPSIRAFVEVFFFDRLPRMMQLDAPTLETLLIHTVRDMRSGLSKLPPSVWDLFQESLEENGYKGGKVNVNRYAVSVPECEIITRSPIALKAIDGIQSVHSTEDVVSILPSLFDPACTALNSALANLSIEGQIHKKTAIFADLNRLMEIPSEGVSGEQRWKRFDATFCVLLHTYYTVNRMTVRRMVCGGGANLENTKGVFYRWVSRFGRRDTTPNDDRDMDNALDKLRDANREKARGFIQRLNSQCPLTEDDSNYSDLFDILPYLARLLFEEAGKNTFDMTTALSTLSSSPSIVYSLLMWLYCLDHSDARVSLVKSMDKVMKEMPGTDDTWKFMLQSSSTLVKEMMKGARTMDCVNSSTMVAAFMIKPLRYRHEVAKAEMVKKAITVSTRGNWLAPWVIDVIESGNHAAKYDWVQLWVREIIKLIVGDEMIEMGELLMGAAMIDPLQTCRAICQVLGDTILDDFNEGEGPPRPEMAPCLFVFLSRFTAQMMMMGVWAITHGLEQLHAIEKEGGVEVEETPKKKLRFEGEYVDDLENEYGMITAHKEEMEATLKALFNRMLKACKKGKLSKSVSAVSLILKEIATGPDIDCSKTLKKMVPVELLELLAFIDPLSVPFELFCTFVSEDENRLEYLCRWKNWKGVEYPEKDEEEEEVNMEEERKVARVL